MLTKREAIRECKELWGEIEKSRLSKSGFLNSKDGEKWLKKGYVCNCPLCDVADANCDDCQLTIQYGTNSDFLSCYDLGFDENEVPTPEWLNAIKGLKE